MRILTVERTLSSPALDCNADKAGSGFDDLQGKVFCDRREAPVVMKQLAMMLKRRGCDDAVIMIVFVDEQGWLHPRR